MIEYGIMTAKAMMMSMMVSSGVPLDEHNVEEMYCMSLNIYYEARGEDWKGKASVAHVVQNRVAHPKYPNTICGVVLQARTWNERPIRDMCQFAWYCDGRSDNPQLSYKSERRKGIEPKDAVIIHANVENKKVCLRFNWYCSCKLPSTKIIPIKIVINEDDKKL